MNEKETIKILQVFCSIMSVEVLDVIKLKGEGYPTNEYECGERDALLAMSKAFKRHSGKERTNEQ